MMNILVLVKPVPDPDKYNEITIDPETKRIVRQDVAAVIDPVSKNALEAALMLREGAGVKDGENSTTVSVLGMAPEDNRDKFIECLAMGADHAYLLSDPAFGGADTFATSYVLAEGVKAAAKDQSIDGFDLILAGNESADGATSHVPVQVAEWLGLPHATGINHIEMTGAEGGFSIRVTKKTEDTLLEMEAATPAVVSVTREINKPRHISAMGIVKARKKPLTIWSNADLHLDEDRIGLCGSPTKAGDLIMPDVTRASKDLVDSDAGAEDVAKAILSLARKAGVTV